MKHEALDRELRKQLLRLEAQQHRLRLGEEFKALRGDTHPTPDSLWQALDGGSFAALIANLLPGRWGRILGVAMAAIRLARRWKDSRKKTAKPDASAPATTPAASRP